MPLSKSTGAVRLEESLERCWQTNSNQSQLGLQSCPLPREKTTPLGKSGDAVDLEEVAAGEASFVVKLVQVGGADRGELLKTSHAPEPVRPIAFH